jgi:hypothetical protein
MVMLKKWRLECSDWMRDKKVVLDNIDKRTYRYSKTIENLKNSSFRA